MNIFQRYLAEEFAEDYEEGRINRRQALRLIASVTGSTLVANTILAACTPPANQGTSGAPTPGATTGNSPAELAPTATQGVPITGATATNTAAAAAETPTLAATAAAETPTVAATATTGATAQGTPAAYGTVSPDDASIQAGEVTFPGTDGTTLMGYQARPASGNGPFGLVLVCHENRGLTAHIQDVTRRLAKAGYAALAVDLLSREGGTAKLSADAIPGALGNSKPDQFIQDFQSGLAYMRGQSFVDQKRLGMVGFCFGGGVTWLAATRIPELQAAVPFYGPHPPIEDVPKIQAAVLAIYGGNDARINQGIPAIEEAMQANGKTYEKMVYEGADHAFHNDTGQRYKADAARDAWGKTLAWFQKYMV